MDVLVDAIVQAGEALLVGPCLCSWLYQRGNIMSHIDELAYDEVQAPIIDAVQVQRRVDNWIDRLTVLFQEVTSWAGQNGWTPAEGAPVPMNEKLMQLTGVPPREQPSLVLTSPKGERVWCNPKGLWVIGANGRVDVYGSRDSLVVIDTAHPFERPAWIMFHLPSNGYEGQIFTPAILSVLV